MLFSPAVVNLPLCRVLWACRIKAPDKLRLAMLYALRYEDTGNLRAVKSRLLDSGLTPEKVDLLDALLQYSGVSWRTPSTLLHVILPGLSKACGTREPVTAAGASHLGQSSYDVEIRCFRMQEMLHVDRVSSVKTTSCPS